MENRFARIMRNTGPARFFLPVGIILIVVGIFLLGANTDDYLETAGTVTSVEESVDADGNKTYDITFTYSAEGKTYTGMFPGLSEKSRVGDTVRVFYDPADPEKTTNSKTGLVPVIMIGLGLLGLAFGVFKTVQAFRKSRELDQTPKAPDADFAGFKTAPGVTEVYCRRDGPALKPGYILEDADRQILFECRMVKQALVGTRTFEFVDPAAGTAVQHEVGHTMTQSYNDEFFSVSSWFKFDGSNVWDILHGRGLRMTTDMRSKFPNLTYLVSQNGEAFALIETSGQYVHEDEAAQHTLNLPVGRYFYRIWTNTGDWETLFLAIFAISETEQAVVE